MTAERALTTKTKTPPPRRTRRQTVRLEIELPVLSDEAAAAMADVRIPDHRDRDFRTNVTDDSV